MTTKNATFEQGAVLLSGYGTVATWRKPINNARFGPSVLILQCSTSDDGVFQPAFDVTVHGTEALHALREAIRLALGEPEPVALPCAPDAALQWRAAGFDRLAAQNRMLRGRLASLEAAHKVAQERNRELWNAVDSDSERAKVLDRMKGINTQTNSKMHADLAYALNAIDAAIFSGNTFTFHDARMALREHLERWNSWDKERFYYAPDGTMMNADGTRSIFANVDK